MTHHIDTTYTPSNRENTQERRGLYAKHDTKGHQTHEEGYRRRLSRFRVPPMRDLCAA